MEEILANLRLSIGEYSKLPDKMKFNDCEVLNGLLKRVSSLLFFLEKYRDSYKRKHDALLYSHIKEGASVAAARVIADEQISEIYMLRRIMSAGYKCLDSIRSNISYLKQEK